MNTLILCVECVLKVTRWECNAHFQMQYADTTKKVYYSTCTLYMGLLAFQAHCSLCISNAGHTVGWFTCNTLL